MEYKAITATEDEVVQSLIDAGFTHDQDGRTLGEQLEQIEQRLRMIDDLYNITVELDARETSSNCVVANLQQFGWDELCDKAIGILEKLKA